MAKSRRENGPPRDDEFGAGETGRPFDLAALEPKPPTELDYLVGRRQWSGGPPEVDGVAGVSLVEMDRRERDEVMRVTRPIQGDPERRIAVALRDRVLRARPGNLLVRAFRVFEPRGLWIRLRALEPLSEEWFAKATALNEARRRWAKQNLRVLRKMVPLLDEGLYVSHPETATPREEKGLFEERFWVIRRQLENAERNATQAMLLARMRRDSFPIDSTNLGLLRRRRLVLYPIIAALRGDNPTYWRYWSRLVDLVRCSDEHWTEDPCPQLRQEYQRDSGIVDAIKVDYRRS